MASVDDDKWLDEALTGAIGSDDTQPDFERWKQNHPEAVKMLTSRARAGSAHRASPPQIWRIIMCGRIAKLGAAAAMIAVACVGVYIFGGLVSGGSVAWADVAERFESVPFFSLTVYAGQDKSLPGKRVEIWKSEDGRVRAHQGNKVVFADFANGKRTIVVFDGRTREPVYAGQPVTAFLEAFGVEGRFSLQTLINSMPPGATNLIPVETAETAASREIVVFESRHSETGEGLRIWALRGSKLPIQMRFSDPRNNEYGDFLFDYSQRKDPAFFDPDVFVDHPVAN